MLVSWLRTANAIINKTEVVTFKYFIINMLLHCCHWGLETFFQSKEQSTNQFAQMQVV